MGIATNRKISPEYTANQIAFVNEPRAQQAWEAVATLNLDYEGNLDYTGRALTEQECEAIKEFLNRGGQIVVLSDGRSADDPRIEILSHTEDAESANETPTFHIIDAVRWIA